VSDPTARVRIAVVDYGMGNRRSVEKALQHVGAQTVVTRDHDELRAADGLVLPGVGAFPRGMANLRELRLDELLRERVAAGVPLLGICLGMQLAFDSSTELGGAEGLGLVGGEVSILQTGGERLPHIGWSVARARAPSPLTDGLPAQCAYYHVHSYAAHPSDDSVVLASAEHGEPFVTAVAQGCFYGVQFHPEKSSLQGLRLLSNFAHICATRTSGVAA
jgi:glutamine amidotransferase